MNYLTDIELDIKEYKDPFDMYPELRKKNRDILPARYREVNGIKDNPDLCALPPFLTGDALITANMSLYINNKNTVSSMSTADRMTAVMDIKDDFKVYLPFQIELERRFFECLCSSYKKRRYGYYDDETLNNIVAVSNQISTSVQDMSLIGTAGTGKSSSVDTMLSRYPRCISQKVSGYFYHQIIYLKVTCTVGRDIKNIFIEFARQIDQIMGYKNIFVDLMNKKSSVPKMESFMVQLITEFHVGIIILDEIQLIVGTKIFEHLLSITASAGVSVMIIGTEAAVKGLNQSAWFSRRFSQLGRVDSDIECDFKGIMESIITQMWTCQWTLEKQMLTRNIIDALIEESGNNIDYLTTLYVTAQFMVIQDEDSVNPSVIDVKLIKKAASRYPMARGLILGGKSELEKMYNIEKQNTFDNFSEKISARRKQETANMVSKSANFFIEKKEIISDIVTRIQSVEEYDKKIIEETYNTLESKGTDFKKMSEKQRAKLILTEIMKEENKKKKNKNKRVAKTKEQKKKNTTNHIEEINSVISELGENDDLTTVLQKTVS